MPLPARLGTDRSGGSRIVCLLVLFAVASCGDSTGVPDPAIALEVVSGSPQIDTVGAVLAHQLVVRAVDKNGRAVAGAAIEFTTSSGGGSVAPAVATTDESGLAEGTWTLGATAGEASVRASLQLRPTSAVTFSATIRWPPLRAVDLDAGYNHGCAVTAEHRLFCWGDNERGQIGDGTTTDRSVAVRIGGDMQFARVTTGAVHTCALALTGEAYCWGENFWGGLGDGTETSRLVPTPVTGGLLFTDLTAGDGYTCGLTADGRVFCWGFLVNASAPTPKTPTEVSGTQRFQSIVGGSYLLCGIDVADVTQCFVGTYAEEGYYGEPGTTWRPQVLAGAPSFTSLAIGLNFSCGLSDVGAAYCWGENQSGQLGTGDTDPRGAPTVVVGNLAFRSLHVGYDWACGITLAGANHCWGHNSWGTLGLPSNPPYYFATPQSMPLPSGVAFTTLEGGFYHMCGIAESSLVYCWAAGFDGQLGDGRSMETDEFHHRITPDIVLRR